MDNPAITAETIRRMLDATAPTYDDIYSQLNEERVNMRARRYLADLRRDAVIEFR